MKKRKMEEEEEELSKDIIILNRSPQQWRDFVLLGNREIKQIVLNVSRSRNANQHPNPHYFNQEIYSSDYMNVELSPYNGYYPISNMITTGMNNNNRIGNRVTVHRIHWRMKPSINVPYGFMGYQAVTFSLYYVRDWRNRRTCNQFSLWRLPHDCEVEMYTNHYLVNYYYVPMLTGDQFRTTDVNNIDGVVLVCKKTFQVNDYDATILTPYNNANINTIEHTVISSTSINGCDITVDMCAPIVYNADNVYDYNLDRVRYDPTVGPDVANVCSGMFLFTFAIENNGYTFTDLDFYSSLVLYYTDG